MTASPIRHSAERGALRKTKSVPYVQLDLPVAVRAPLTPDHRFGVGVGVGVGMGVGVGYGVGGEGMGRPGEADEKGGLAITKATWAESEDAELLAAVKAWGTLWPVVAAQLPGRTPDAVRNRWHRLRHQQRSSSTTTLSDAGAGPMDLASLPPDLASGRGSSSSFLDVDSDAAVSVSVQCGSPTHKRPPPPAPAVVGGNATSLDNMPPVDSRGVHSRACWTAHEDDVILEGVRRYGCRWRQIAARLPNRSDSSVRNRWVRLQTMSRRTESDVSTEGEQPSPTAAKSVPGMRSALFPTGSGDDAAAPIHPTPALNRQSQSWSETDPMSKQEDSTAHILVSFASQSITSA